MSQAICLMNSLAERAIVPVIRINLLDHYAMITFAEDLTSVLDVLVIHSPILCGFSLGGGIAQMFAVRMPERLKGLILASSAVSIRLTLMDKIHWNVFSPERAVRQILKMISVEKFIRLSLGLARFTQGKH